MCAVENAPELLRVKLIPPRLSSIISRKRLFRVLEGARSAKLTSLVAGAGYGKSTLVADFLQKAQCPFIWYDLDDTDADLSVFLNYLVEGFGYIYSGFGVRTRKRMAAVVNVSGQSRILLSTFIAELDEHAEEDVFVVLDDFQAVNESPSITEALGFILGNTLPNIHFIVLSRSELNLPLYKLRAGREVLELKESSLGFTVREAERLFAEVFGMPLREEEVSALVRSTEGWVVGLILFHLAQKKSTSEEISVAIRESPATPAELIDYLSRAVFDGQPERVKDFAVRTCILDRLNPAFCDELLGIDGSAGILSYLVKERLFTISLDEKNEWFRYHNMLRVFLLEEAEKRLTPSEVRDLHRAAGDLWAAHEDWEMALYHYMEGQDHARAADVLEGIVDRLMRANRVSYLYREIFRLPREVLEERPALVLNGAQIAARLGDYDRVVDAALTALEGFGRSGGAEERALSLLRLAGAFFGVGRLVEAREMISRARDVMPEGSPFRCELLALEGTVLAAAGGEGEEGETERVLEEALRLAGEHEGTELGSRALGFCGMGLFLRGRLSEAVEVFAHADRYLEETGLLATHPFTYALLSRAYAFLDRLQEAVETADKGVALGEEHGLMPMVFFNRASRALALAYLENREQASEDADIAASMCSRYEDIAQVAFAEWFLGEAYGLLGKEDLAMCHFQRGERMVARYGDSRKVAVVSMIAAASMGRDAVKAAEEVSRALEAVREGSSGIALSLAYALLFTLYLSAGRNDEARATLDSYTGMFGKDVILRTCLTDVASLLSFFEGLFSQGKYLGLMERVFGIGGARSVPYLRRLMRGGDVYARAMAGHIIESPGLGGADSLCIRMLGPLQVERGRQTLTAKEWRSKKACGIFKYLAANRRKGLIPRDVLMEMQWSDTPLESAQRNLNTALTFIRKTLEPEAARGESSYLVSKGDALGLELGNGGWVDVELFEDGLRGAEKAKEIGDFDLYLARMLETADLYRGDFCPEDPYEDWCQSQREELKDEYVDLLKELAYEHLRRGMAEKASQYMKRAIDKDPGREDLYRHMMLVCGMGGDRAGIEEAFQGCSRYLRENYEVAPSPETSELYQKLRSR